MNSTNRFANRLLLVIVGLLLLVAGLVGVALAAVPSVASGWKQQAPAVRSGAPSWVGSPVVGTASVLTLLLIAAAIVLIVLLVVFITRQGRGHTSEVVTRATSATARTRIDLSVPRSLLADHLAERPEFVSNRVAAYTVRRTPVLKVSVRARRGISPTDAARIVTDALASLDALLGVELPALVQISGGFRARLAKPARLS